MKKIISTCLFIFVTLQLLSQKTSENYIEKGDAICAKMNYKRIGYKEAYDNYTKAIELHPPAELLSRAYYKRAYMGGQYISTKPEFALKDLDKAIELSPNYFEAYKLRAELGKFASQPFQNALPYDKSKILKDYDKLIELKNTDAKLYYERGQFHSVYLHNYQPALLDYKKSIELDPTNAAHIYCLMADIKARNLNNYKGGIEDCNKALETDPKYFDAYTVMARLKKDLAKDPKGAIEDFDKAIQLAGNDSLSLAYIYQERSELQLETGDHKNAIAGFDKVIEYCSGFEDNDKNDFMATAYRTKAKINFLMQNDKDALENLDKAAQYYLKFDQETAGIIYNEKAKTQFKLKEYAKALDDFDKSDRYAYENFLSDTNTHYIHAICYINLKLYKKALPDLNYIIVNLDTTNADVFLQRGIVFYFLKKNKESIKDLDRSLILGLNKNAGLYYFRGLDKLFLKEMESALEDFNKAIEIDPNYAYAYYQRANLKHKKGDLPACCSDLKKANELGLSEAKVNLQKYCK